MKKVHCLELGGTLFIPASHKKLSAIVSGKKYKQLRSLVIDFEDGLEEDALHVGVQNLKSVLAQESLNGPLVFVRAKNVEHLKSLLVFENTEKITGFVLAKFSLTNAEEYLQALQDTKYLIMPSIEGEELFNHQRLHTLKEIILTNKERVLLVRFGLEDMLRQLGMRRSCEHSLFDYSVTASVIGNFIATFKSAGFGVSGGVYPCFNNGDGFIRDVQRDMHEGLTSKTIIHPNQIEPINELYKITKKELDEAKEILQREQKVFNQDGKMAETLTMSRYSEEILKHAEIYGCSDSKEN